MIVPCINCCRMQTCSVVDHYILKLVRCFDYMPEEIRECDKEYLKEIQARKDNEPIVMVHAFPYESD